MSRTIRLPWRRHSRYAAGGLVTPRDMIKVTLHPDEHVVRQRDDKTGYHCTRPDHEGRPCRGRWDLDDYVITSNGHEIIDPDEAEALGLTVDARRMRERRA